MNDMNWLSFSTGVLMALALLVCWVGMGEDAETEAREASWQSIMDIEREEGRL